MASNIQLPNRVIQLKTSGQRDFVNHIRNSTITFAHGPAGTGKTFLAVACAIEALLNEDKKLILVRPAVEVGERIGHLPGTIDEKISPYLRPIYDAIHDCLLREDREKFSKKIEIAPIGFMRGRTFNNSFVVCDEAQNTTISQMKMFLTRLGYKSKMVIVGDTTQIDLQNQSSGLTHVLSRLKNIKDIAITELTATDIRRHSLVEKILNVFDE